MLLIYSEYIIKSFFLVEFWILSKGILWVRGNKWDLGVLSTCDMPFLPDLGSVPCVFVRDPPLHVILVADSCRTLESQHTFFHLPLSSHAHSKISERRRLISSATSEKQPDERGEGTPRIPIKKKKCHSWNISKFLSIWCQTLGYLVFLLWLYWVSWPRLILCFFSYSEKLGLHHS